MKGQEEMGDEELIEIDEKDRPIQTKKDKEKSNKPLSKSNIVYSSSCTSSILCSASIGEIVGDEQEEHKV